MHHAWLSTPLFAALLGCGSAEIDSTGFHSTPTNSSITEGSTLESAQSGKGRVQALCPDADVAPVKVSKGVVCAIKPSATDGSLSDAFGYHAIAFPPGLHGTKLYLHLVGSDAMPYNPARGVFPDLQVIEEALAHGYTVVMLAYPNVPSVASLCGDNTACFEPTRLNIIEGVGGIEPRISALLAHLLRRNFLGKLPANAVDGVTLRYSAVRIGGHSQGGGHAALMSRERGFARTCLLSSPVDAGSTRWGLASADWIQNTAHWATPTSRMRGIVNVAEAPYNSVTLNLKAMGLKAKDFGNATGGNWVEVEGGGGNAHASTVKSPEFADERAWACFQ